MQIIVIILIISLYITRRRDYNIIPRRSGASQQHVTNDDLIEEDEFQPRKSGERGALRPSNHPRWQSSPSDAGEGTRFERNIHSRVLQKFPFLIEMFYWWLNYLAYKYSKELTAVVYNVDADGITDLARNHGESVLAAEHESFLSLLFLVKEIDVQRFFLEGSPIIMAIINRLYSMVHIPGTMAFLGWFYYSARNHDQFAIARRTMTLGNFVAFVIFALWPCMPPRLLPEKYGFIDSVRTGHSESVWVGGVVSVTQYGAMPSLHFTYALVTGSCLFWQSGFIQSLRGRRRERGLLGMAAYMVAGICYPTLVLTVIVATANHYYLDAVAATFSICLCFLCNRVWCLLLPVERWLAWILRVDKPVPTTGERRTGSDDEQKEYSRLRTDELA